MHCPACQHENPSGAKFCLECGSRLAPAAPAPAPKTPPPASLGGGRYRVERLLGEGARKRVYLARDTKLDRDVALSLIKGEGLDETGRVRVEREAQAMARLGDHPNIVTVFDIAELDGALTIVSQFMAGGSLADRVTAERVPLSESLRVAGQIAAALEHAHARGVIHRDLKPGNVWLAADGTAKLGDFGLALALDRSRLTAEGQLVGTIAYMAPEQALGGEVTPRADLYALGAVLYELVTGRPVFAGDDAVAIVSQHLNTAPIDPSWHEPALPAALTALILSLLEKDPAKRPESAAEVRRVLAALESLPVPAQPEPAPARPSYRTTFVGRETELHQLRAAFDAALSGHGSLVTVVGEPGIGKTSVCEQLATYAALRGGRTLVGHCYEEGSLALPYLPFVEALRSYVTSRDAERLTRELGPGAGDVARIVSEVRERIAVAPMAIDDPDEARYRLLHSVTTFLRNASAVQSLVLVLEDMHDADRGTLDLLTHLARNLDGARLLVVATYRDVEVDRAHPLSAALAELRRLAGFARIGLRGLDVDEVSRMLSALAHRDVPWSLAETVHRATEGNPLFVQEVMRHLGEEGLLTRDTSGSRTLSDSQLAARIPEGLRDVIGKRLSRLSPDCNRVLAIASVIGREFRLDTLCAVAAVPEDAVIAALEEAVRVAVLREEARGNVVRYRFAHAFFRQTLYEESIAPRRIRIHQQVARALESQYAARLEDHAAELAEHFSYSSDPADLAKAVRYGELAAARARAVSAYTEAVHHLERSLEVQELLTPDDREKRYELLMALGETLSPAGQPRRAIEEVGPEAFALAESLADDERAARACTLVLFTLGQITAGFAMRTSEAQPWLDRATRYARPHTIHGVWLDIYRGNQLGVAEPAEARRLFLRAFAQARELGEPTALAYSAFLCIAWVASTLRPDESLELIRQCLAQPRRGARAIAVAGLLGFAAQNLRACGAREEADAAFRELEELARRTRDPEVELGMLEGHARRALVAGDFERAEALSMRAFEQGRALAREAQVVSFSAMNAELARYLQGRPLTGLARISLAEGLGPGPLWLARYGDVETARRIVQLGTHDPKGAQRAPFFQISLLETAVQLGDRDAVTRLSEWLAPAAVWCLLGDVCPARILGGAAVLLGKYDRARAYYLQALERAGMINYRPELALTHLELAELLLDHFPSERGEAESHLDATIPELRAMRMAPALERALRRKLELQGVTRHAQGSIEAVARSLSSRRPDVSPSVAPDGTVTLLFSDMEGFTPMTERLGDRAAYRVIQDHNRIVREQLAAHAGHELELQGDGFVLAFSRAQAGVRCATGIQRAFAAYSAAHPEQPIRVRIGLHRGEAIRDRDRFFGRTVILAARIAAEARAGEILVSSSLADAAGSSDFRFGPARELELKGIAEPQSVRAVEWE